MYKNVYYDRESNSIYEREVGSTEYVKHPYTFKYFMPDSSGESPIRDCFGVPMKEVVCKTKEDYQIYRVMAKKMRLAESDLKPPVKYIHEKYDTAELNYEEYKDYRIAFYDIETQTSRRYYLNKEVKLRLIEDGHEETMTLYQFEHTCKTKKWEIWDIVRNEWRKYYDSCFINQEFPNPEEANYPINLITVYSTVAGETFTWGLEPYEGNSPDVTNYKWFESELEMMKDFYVWFWQQKFDILTGWNSEKFDDAYIIGRMQKIQRENGVKLDYTRLLSPLKLSPQKRPITDDKGKVTGYHFSSPGLYMIDYLALYKFIGFVKNSPSWKLDYIGKKETGEGKVKLEYGLTEHYIKDYTTYVEYNVQDVRLMVKIEEKKRLWPTTIAYANEALITLDSVFAMTAAHDGYIMKFLHAQNQVYNDRYEKPADWWHDEGYFKKDLGNGIIEYQNCTPESPTSFEPYAVKAGYCYADPGRYQHNMSGDITSSYPNHIIMYNISPETRVIKPSQEDIDSGKVIRSEVNGVGFINNDTAILPSVVSKIFDERLKFKLLMQDAEKAGDKIAADRYRTLQPTRKKLINSLYGACLFPQFHLFNIDCARSITRCARVTIRYLKDNTDRYYRSKYILKDSMDFFPVIKINTKWYKKEDEVETDQGKILAKDVTTANTINGAAVTIFVNDLTQKALLNPIKKITSERIINVVYDGDCHYYKPGDEIEVEMDGKKLKMQLGVHDGGARFTGEETIMEELKANFKHPDGSTISGFDLQRNAKIDGRPIDNVNVIEKPVKFVDRESVVVQVDTDSNYYCFDEHKINLFPYMDDMEWFYCMEKQMNWFWKRILDAKAEKNKMHNRIIFTRENMFSNFISYGKKMYLGSVVDKDGKFFGYEEDPHKHLKIQGLILKKAEFPVFCQEYAVKITADVLLGQSKEETTKQIQDAYLKFKASKPEDISASRTIGDLSVMDHEIDWYVKNGLTYPDHIHYCAKIGVNFNYVNAREKLGYDTLQRGSKAKHIFLYPRNKYGFDQMAFEKWPKEFDQMFEIDYDTTFEKFFMSNFHALFECIGWAESRKDYIEYKMTKAKKKFLR